MDKREKFINKSVIKHGNKYNYSKVEYIDSKTKVCIVCPEHGEFWQTPAAHVRGDSCPFCANIKRGNTFRGNVNEFIEKARQVHGDKYDYSKVEYINANTKVCIVCPEHGEFWQEPVVHIKQESGCPKCVGKNMTTEQFIERARQVHGDKYNYSKVEYKKAHEKVCIVCPKHGEFWQTPSKHLMGRGCPKCGINYRGKERLLTTDEFIEKARQVHGDKYDYSKVEYRGTKENVIITCKTHGDFFQKPNYHLCGHGCHICGNNMSNGEGEIKSFLDGLGISYIEKDRSILDKKEIDIYIPYYKLGIEFDGLYWHSEIYKDKNYHLNKTEECLKKGIRLIHVFEDEWLNKQDIVKSMITNTLGKTKNHIYGRECVITEVNDEVKKDFLYKNHIQGNIFSTINIGLLYNGELVSLMCFGSPRINLGRKHVDDDEYELLRFCSKIGYVVTGAASKIFKYFIKVYNPKEIVSYCDRRYGTGNMYEKLGFVFSHKSQPNYFYIEGLNRKNRFKYRKSELVKEGFDKNKSEKEIMLERKIYRIYDCGTLVYKWKKETIK